MATTYSSSFQFGMVTLFHVVSMARGSCVPSSTNTMPLSVNEMTRHTLVDTMFRRDTFGPAVRGAMTFTRPAATTARMPLPPSWSAAKNTMNGVNTSNST